MQLLKNHQRNFYHSYSQVLNNRFISVNWLHIQIVPLGLQTLQNAWDIFTEQVPVLYPIWQNNITFTMIYLPIIS